MCALIPQPGQVYVHASGLSRTHDLHACPSVFARNPPEEVELMHDVKAKRPATTLDGHGMTWFEEVDDDA